MLGRRIRVVNTAKARDGAGSHTIAAMARKRQESGRSKRRQPRKGFPHRIVAYLDDDSKRLLETALKLTGENTSMFTSRALVDRAERVVQEHAKK